MNRVAFLARLVLAAVFLYAGWDKAWHPGEFAAQVAAYRLVPAALVTLVAVWLPWLELLAGACLALGLLAESSALLLGLLSLTFGAGATSALVRGLAIDCGCFSTRSSGPVSWGHVALDLGLMALAALVLWWGPGSPALDRRLEG